MVRAFFVLISANLLFCACTQRMICPAYQSAFIYDQEELRKKFSYFDDDSTPKIYTASKNKYLVAEDLSYKRRLRGIQTVPMKPVMVAVPDSLLPGYVEGMEGIADGEDGVVPGAEMDLAARSVIDSTFIVDVPRDTAQIEEDSVYMISKDKEVRVLVYDTRDSLIYDSASGRYVPKTPKYYVKEVKFNVDQDNYMWYLRNYLVLPDVKLAHQNQSGGGGNGKAAKGKKEKKGFFGFFKDLFKKKKKDAPADSTILQPPVKSEDDFDYVDEEEQQQLQQQQLQNNQQNKPEKKGVLGFLKKKKKADAPPAGTTPADAPKEKKSKRKKDKETEEAPSTDEEKQEEEEDGF